MNELRDLKQLVYHQRNITLQQQIQIDADKTRIDSQQTEITSLTQELTRVSHTESGHIDCGDSRFWTSGSYTSSWHETYGVTKSVHVSFNTAYSTTPHVQLSIVGIHTNSREHNEEYGVILENVGTSGFTMRCMTWRSDYPVHDMDVTWTSTAA